MNNQIIGAETISLFCRLNVNIKKDLPIRSSEMGLLIYVVKSELEPIPIKMAEFFKVTKPMITNIINALATKGYIKKQKSKSDARSIIIVATKKGVSLVDKTYKEYLKTMNQLEINMGSDDYSAMIKLLNKANSILLEVKDNG